MNVPTTSKRGWIKDHDDGLRELHASGLTFQQIADGLEKRFGVHYTRNACIGRALRIGLTRNVMMLTRMRAKSAITREETKREQHVPHDTKARRHRRRYKAKQEFLVAPEGAVKEMAGSLPHVKRSNIPAGSIASRTIHSIRASERGGELTPDTRPMRCAEVEPKHLTIADLDQYTCRWPYGGWPAATPITFCGHFAEKDEPYCCEHQDLASGRGTRSERDAHRVTLAPAA